jgi:hypothetical protein
LNGSQPYEAQASLSLKLKCLRVLKRALLTSSSTSTELSISKFQLLNENWRVALLALILLSSRVGLRYGEDLWLAKEEGSSNGGA